MSNNCVIIGDIKKSRNLENWEKVFIKLDQALGKINRGFSKFIVVDFKPTVGDEFQGVLTTPEKGYEIYRSIRDELQIDIYFGIGVGKIEKPFTQEVGMRGSAFYRARDALELCKKKNRNIFIKSSDTFNLTDDTINTLLRFIEVFENSWTKRQREIINYYRLHPNYTYEQLSRHFGFSKQTASKVLKAANWDLVSEGYNLINKLLKNIGLNKSNPKMVDK